MQETIDQAKGSFLQSKDRVVRLLNTTPDDRINWSPSPGARTPVQVVAHIAAAIKNIHKTVEGDTFSVPTTKIADKGFREWERQFNTREQVLDMLEANSAAFVAFLDALRPDQLGTMVKMPFDLGFAPMSMAITFPAMHTMSHVSQLEYIQTIYNDHDWYM